MRNRVLVKPYETTILECPRGRMIDSATHILLGILDLCNVTSTPGHVLTTSLLRPKKIKDVVRTWYGLVGRGRNVVRT